MSQAGQAGRTASVAAAARIARTDRSSSPHSQHAAAERNRLAEIEVERFGVDVGVDQSRTVVVPITSYGTNEPCGAMSLAPLLKPREHEANFFVAAVESIAAAEPVRRLVLEIELVDDVDLVV